MSIFNKITRFAKSPQGRRLTDQAMRAARDPKTKAKIREVSGRFGSGKRPTNRPPH